MNILIVCSKNSGRISPFIVEQAKSLVQKGLKVEYFTIAGKGFTGYLKNYKNLVGKIKAFKPDIIHAHYGLSGLLCNIQRKIPVITTYHGSDINEPRVYPFSLLNMLLSAHNIFVSKKNQQKSGFKTNHSLIPCGVDTKLFREIDKLESRNLLGFKPDKKYILFAGGFQNNVKNSELAIKAVQPLSDVTLLELKGYSREQVVVLMNGVDLVLMTSFTEGSPQFIKEAMACNCPIVSVPAGDVPEITQNISGCFITSYRVEDVSQKIIFAIEFGQRTEGRSQIINLGLEIENVAEKIISVYNKVLNNK